MDPSHPAARTLSTIPTDRTDRTVMLDDTELRLRYDPEPGVDLRVHATGPDEPGVEVVSTVFEAAADRPPSYPPELPYLPGVKVSVLGAPDRPGAGATWFIEGDVDPALAQIRAQSEAAGWTEAPASGEPLPPGLRMLTFVREGRERMVVVASFGGTGTITISDG